MTKKAEKAAAVAERKWQAWRNKVRVLTGHMVYDRARDLELYSAYQGGVTADEFAATLAAREPVGKALHPAKVDAVTSATEHANITIGEVEKDLEANGWDLQKAAPYPDSRMSRSLYVVTFEKYKLYSGLTESIGTPGGRRYNDPNPVQMSEQGKARFVKGQQEKAAFEYDRFICKMVVKVGECESAEIRGSHIWSESTLTVHKAGDVTERWRTHQIINRSKFGIYFPAMAIPALVNRLLTRPPPSG